MIKHSSLQEVMACNIHFKNAILRLSLGASLAVHMHAGNPGSYTLHDGMQGPHLEPCYYKSTVHDRRC